MSVLRPLRLALVAVVLTVSGCDTASPSVTDDGSRFFSRVPVATASVARDGQPTGDFLYDLSPLEAGEQFVAALRGATGTVALRFTGVGNRRGEVELLVDGSIPADVWIEYVFDGTIVGTRKVGAQPHSGDGVAAFSAGITDREPDSIHYVTYPDGTIRIEYDYKDDSDDPDATPGTVATASDGERLPVTHLRYTLRDTESGPPEVVEFMSAGPFELR